jgi:hypothetical protein
MVVYVGHYDARSRAVVDTDPATPLDDTVALVPGTYEFLARADGHGTQRFTFTVRAGQVRDLPVQMRPNLASAHNGAEATGDGVNLDNSSTTPRPPTGCRRTPPSKGAKSSCASTLERRTGSRPCASSRSGMTRVRTERRSRSPSHNPSANQGQVTGDHRGDQPARRPPEHQQHHRHLSPSHPL